MTPDRQVNLAAVERILDHAKGERYASPAAAIHDVWRQVAALADDAPLPDVFMLRRPPGLSDDEWRDWCGYARVAVALHEPPT